jgi:ABC-type antimicrobial peptide transport system permease subunit
MVSYAVAQRAPEIGVRLALGAERGTVLWMSVRSALRPVTMGLVAAIPLALVATPGLRVVLFGLAPHDPMTIASFCLALVITGLVAAIVPARRAANLDPVSALRRE